MIFSSHSIDSLFMLEWCNGHISIVSTYLLKMVMFLQHAMTIWRWDGMWSGCFVADDVVNWECERKCNSIWILTTPFAGISDILIIPNSELSTLIFMFSYAFTSKHFTFACHPTWLVWYCADCRMKKSITVSPYDVQLELNRHASPIRNIFCTLIYAS